MPSNTTGQVLVSTPAIPKAVGVWIAVAAPVAVAWLLAPPSAVDAIALGIALVSLLVAQHTSILLLRRRAPDDACWWLAVELLVALLCGSFLVIIRHLSDLVLVAAAATALFGVGDLLRRRTSPTQGAGSRTHADLVNGWALALSAPKIPT